MDCQRLIASALLLILADSPRAVAQPVEPARQEEPVLGAPANIAPNMAEGSFLWLDQGTRIRRSPSVGAPSIAVVDVRIEVPIVERREQWILVRYGGWKGWIPVDRQGNATRQGPAVTGPERRQLARARDALGLESGPEKLGPFDLYTDVTDRKLLRFLGRIVESLPNAYGSRYGIDPGGEAREVAVIFSHRDDYRAFSRTSTAGRQVHGHTTKGMAVVFVGNKSPEEVGAILVHEWTHLLNRRVFRTAPYPWLENNLD